VDLGSIRLAGSSTSRHVELDVSVDGAAGPALGVMSQGEVNALALSVFLPRARLPASPFRFLVIDDPVQAMDPAKVDGLARVLEKAAAGRQVIVFTHDNRLAQAVRQLRLAATILEVTRRPGSAVEVRPSLGPVQQASRRDPHQPRASPSRRRRPPVRRPGGSPVRPRVHPRGRVRRRHPPAVQRRVAENSPQRWPMRKAYSIPATPVARPDCRILGACSSA
jgi:hypothetical protein